MVSAIHVQRVQLTGKKRQPKRRAILRSASCGRSWGQAHRIHSWRSTSARMCSGSDKIEPPIHKAHLRSSGAITRIRMLLGARACRSVAIRSRMSAHIVDPRHHNVCTQVLAKLHIAPHDGPERALIGAVRIRCRRQPVSHPVVGTLNWTWSPSSLSCIRELLFEVAHHFPLGCHGQ